eukprot:3182460-Pleurochrysis_carterae.AAC.2
MEQQVGPLPLVQAPALAQRLYDTQVTRRQSEREAYTQPVRDVLRIMLRDSPCNVVWHRVVGCPITRVVTTRLLLGTLHDNYTSRITDCVQGDCDLEKYAMRNTIHYVISTMRSYEIVHKQHFQINNKSVKQIKYRISCKKQPLVLICHKPRSKRLNSAALATIAASARSAPCGACACCAWLGLRTQCTRNGRACAGRLGVRVRCSVASGCSLASSCAVR